MNIRPTSGNLIVFLLPLAVGMGRADAPRVQDVGQGPRDVYFQAVADHFQVPADEVAIIGDWELEVDEVPVVLFLAHHAGVSPDALIGLRRQGRSWREVALQLGLGMRRFHVALPEDRSLGVLDRVHREFTERPPREWDRIQLDDREIIFLVNLRVLSEQAGVPPLRVLQARRETSNFPECLVRLVGAQTRP